MQKTAPSLITILASSACTTTMLLLISVGWSAWAEDSELDSGPRNIPYNGVLDFNGTPFTGNADVQFTLTDDGECNFVEDHEDVPVYAGRFSVNLGQPTGDLPACLFDASAVYLQMAIRSSEDDGEHVALSGRQRINPVPFAYWAAEGSDFKVDGQLQAESALLGDTTIDGTLTTTSSIIPPAGSKGINWADNPFGGSGDDAWIQYYRDGNNENTALQIGINNDADDDLEFYQDGSIRMSIGAGNVTVSDNLSVGTISGVNTINSGGQAFSTGGDVTINGNLSVTGDLLNLSLNGPHSSNNATLGQATGVSTDNSICFITNTYNTAICAVYPDDDQWKYAFAPATGTSNHSCIAYCLTW